MCYYFYYSRINNTRLNSTIFYGVWLFENVSNPRRSHFVRTTPKILKQSDPYSGDYFKDKFILSVKCLDCLLFIGNSSRHLKFQFYYCLAEDFLSLQSKL